MNASEKLDAEFQARFAAWKKEKTAQKICPTCKTPVPLTRRPDAVYCTEICRRRAMKKVKYKHKGIHPVQAFRVSRGWNVATLAEKFGLSESYVAQIEQGRNAGYAFMERIEKTFGIKLNDLPARNRKCAECQEKMHPEKPLHHKYCGNKCANAVRLRKKKDRQKTLQARIKELEQKVAELNGKEEKT